MSETNKMGVRCANHIWDTSGQVCLICGGSYWKRYRMEKVKRK